MINGIKKKLMYIENKDNSPISTLRKLYIMQKLGKDGEKKRSI
jgi:hypothetical protein